jgi:hypothetical protein
MWISIKYWRISFWKGKKLNKISYGYTPLVFPGLVFDATEFEFLLKSCMVLHDILQTYSKEKNQNAIS